MVGKVARRRAIHFAVTVLAVLIAAIARERVDRPPPAPIPEGWNPVEYAIRNPSTQTLVAGDVLFLEGNLFRNERIETDLRLESGGVAEVFFHRRERDIQVQSDYGLVGRKAFDWYAFRISSREGLPCGFVKSTGLNRRDQKFVAPAEQWIHLRLVSQDGEHVAYIDDVEVDRFEDFEYPWGETGLVPIEGTIGVRAFTATPLRTSETPPLRWTSIGTLVGLWLTALGLWVALLGALDDGTASREGSSRAAMRASLALAAFGVIGGALGWNAAWVGAGPLAAATVAFGHVLLMQHRLKGAQGLLMLHVVALVIGLESFVRDTSAATKWDASYVGGYVKDRFLFWHMEPGSRVWESYINSFGFRGNEIDLHKPEGTTRVLCLGGSSTYGDGISDSHDTYPAVLEDLLNAGSDRHYEVLNAGVSGYTTFQALRNLRRDLLRLSPDIVTVDFAHNDKVPSEVGVPYREHWAKTTTARSRWVTSIQDTLHRSRLYMGLVATITGMVDAEEIGPPPIALTEDQIDDDLPVDPRPSRVPTFDFEKNLNAFCALADSFVFELVLIPEPTYNFYYDPPDLEDYYEIMRAVGDEQDRPVVDSVDALMQRRYDVLFYDDVHLTELGAKLLAQSIYSTLRSELSSQRDLASPDVAIRGAKRARRARRIRERSSTDPIPRPKPHLVRRRQAYLDSFTAFFLNMGAECPEPEGARSRVRESLGKKSIAVDSGLGEQALLLGVAGYHRAHSDHESALVSLLRAREADPAVAAIQLEVAREAIALTRFDLARDALAAAQEYAPGDPRPCAELARLALLQGKAQEAVEAARAAVERDERSPASLYLLGEAYRRSGKMSECRAAWERLVDVAPTSDETRRVRGALKQPGQS
ncbi:MAG: hypothetical protein CME06_03110 [Gemmatimonadetes bacterium]|nr:hypothetical protein [Gemmatimonadota bacterium]